MASTKVYIKQPWPSGWYSTGQMRGEIKMRGDSGLGHSDLGRLTVRRKHGLGNTKPKPKENKKMTNEEIMQSALAALAAARAGAGAGFSPAPRTVEEKKDVKLLAELTSNRVTYWLGGATVEPVNGVVKCDTVVINGVARGVTETFHGYADLRVHAKEMSEAIKDQKPGPGARVYTRVYVTQVYGRMNARGTGEYAKCSLYQGAHGALKFKSVELTTDEMAALGDGAVTSIETFKPWPEIIVATAEESAAAEAANKAKKAEDRAMWRGLGMMLKR